MSCRNNSLIRARTPDQTSGPDAMKALMVGCANTPAGARSISPSLSSTAKSRMLSPMATPTRGFGDADVENTPYGRFWIGKSDSASTVRNERSAGSFGWVNEYRSFCLTCAVAPVNSCSIGSVHRADARARDDSADLGLSLWSVRIEPLL